MKTILEFMKLEHMNLHRGWVDFTVEKNKERASKLLIKFSDNLLKHIQLEDGALSPSFNKYLNIEKGVGQAGVMHSDHIAIMRLLDKVKVAFDLGKAEELTYANNHFERALLKHHEREESMQYVFFDKIIKKEEWEAILAGAV